MSFESTSVPLEKKLLLGKINFEKFVCQNELFTVWHRRCYCHVWWLYHKQSYKVVGAPGKAMAQVFSIIVLRNFSISFLKYMGWAEVMEGGERERSGTGCAMAGREKSRNRFWMAGAHCCHFILYWIHTCREIKNTLWKQTQK